jgi:sulfite reductase alpha subunit-like flavoprotein
MQTRVCNHPPDTYISATLYSSSNKMPLGVRSVIRNAAMKEGNMTEEDASKWIAKLEWEGRLIGERWS